MKTSTYEKLKELRRYVNGGADTWYEYFMLVVIVVNTISLGLETVKGLSEQFSRILFWVDQICLWLFIAELIFKFVVYNKDFFADHGTDENGKPERHINLWNIFDLLIVLISIFSSFSYLAVFRVFRILRSLKATRAIRSFRIIKALKLVNALGKFRSILKGLIRAIPEILWVFLLLLLFEYVYAVIGTNFFGSEFPEYFGSLGASLLTLCQISWISGVARPIILAHPAASVYFISYWFITACVLLKVIVGIIVNSMNDERNSKVNLKKTVTHEKLSAQITALQKQIEQLENAIVTKK